ncbi:HAD-IIA family hydrolase [Alicyclobacillus pomorum]|uniref:HAD-IIA family hydrolase n=1 Tax=Alicyclobacillus pomorum TaxID=204470 RepID=UPI0004211006|nr:HAD-IIA family hydrolase [Alicyclobacillus pomorum]
MNHTQRRWKAALLDLDGTLYRGETVIPGAVEFVQRLRKRGIQPVFFTNNATRTPGDVCLKLKRLGFDAFPNEVCTSAQAAARYLQREVAEGSKVGYLGQSGLSFALEEAGLVPVSVAADDADVIECSAAVLGLDPTATYQSLARFCNLVGRLGAFVLTNADVRLPADDTFLPGNGALGSFVSTATGVSPYVAGKPNPDFVQYVLERFQVSVEDVLVIGDNLETDVASGVLSGVYTIHVQTGVVYSEAQNGEVRGQWQPNETWPSVASLFQA